jgi:hypothetical protein
LWVTMFSRWSASGPFPSGMGSIPGVGENFPSEHPQKIQKKINVWGAGKPSTYFEGSGIYVSNVELPEIKKNVCRVLSAMLEMIYILYRYINASRIERPRRYTSLLSKTKTWFWLFYKNGSQKIASQEIKF